MKDTMKALVLASFAADALALGPHWIYDTAQIDTAFGRVEDLRDPLPTTFHKGKRRGQFTHYGDQALMLLESVMAEKSFDPARFAGDWQRMFAGYTGYRDHATRATLENLSEGASWEKAGSGSTDLGGASRIAPLGALFAEDPERFAAAARQQTALTHNQQDVVDAAEFFARVAAAVVAGSAPVAAVETVAARFDRSSVSDWVAKGFASAGRDTRSVIKDFGQQCSIGAAFPAVIHLLTRYPDDLKTALVENVMAGGDSAARGMIVGMVLGAHLGTAAIPQNWLTGMAAYARIVALMQ
ncbi:MAG: ADP-ribosylglycohydrolase family protein [Pseudomonadota bacterium]